MLTFFCGRAGYGKTTRLWQQLKADLNNKVAKRYVVLVPEQFSFSAEKELADFFENKLAINIEVASFGKLAEEVLRQFCKNPSNLPADAAYKAATMLAVNAASPKLAFYKTATDPAMLPVFTTAIKQLKSAAIKEPDLDRAAATAKGSLKNKLKDIKEIYFAYNQLTQSRWQSKEDNLTIACALLGAHPEVLKNTNFYIDAFFSFSNAELNFLKQLLLRADLFLAIVSGQQADEANAFWCADQTQTQLKAYAESEGIKTFEVTLPAPALRFKTPELAHIERNILKLKPEKFPFSAQNLQLVCAKDYQEEVLYLAAQITKLVKDRKLRFKDICVLVRNISDYAEAIELVFKKYEIEYIKDVKQPASNTLVVKLVLSLVSVLQTNLETDEVLELAQNPLLGLNVEELWHLKEYCISCAIKRSDWYQGFSQRPLFNELGPKAPLELLDELNELRKDLIAPILRISKNKQSLKTGQQLATAILEYIIEAKVMQGLNRLSLGAKNTQTKEDAKFVWGKFVGVLDEFVEFCNRFCPSSFEVSLELLKIFLESTCFEFPNPGLDQVLISSAETARPFNPKVVFILGATSNNFPHIEPNFNNIFTPAEQNKIKATPLAAAFLGASSPKGLGQNSPSTLLANQEKLIFYSAITAASHSVYVSFAQKGAKNGAELNPSPFVEALQSMFNLPYQNVNQLLNETDLIVNEQTAVEALCEHYGTGSELEAALLELLKDFDCFGRLNSRFLQKSLPNAARFKLSSPAVLNTLKTVEWKVSATSIETFAVCRFRFFCSRVLNLTTTPSTAVGKKGLGSILHFVLYSVFARYFEANPDLPQNPCAFLQSKAALIADLSDPDKAEELVKTAVDTYFKISFGQKPTQTPRKRYIQLRICDIALKTLRNVLEEIKCSNFTPFRFEQKLAQKFNIPGFSVTLNGKADRIDILPQNGQTWARVVDYKSGKKRFSLVNFLCGVQIQAPFYMKLLLDSNPKLLAAGALYMPIKPELLTLGAAEFWQQACHITPPKMYGAVTNDIEILQQMEPGVTGKLVPAAINKNGELKKSSFAFSKRQFGLMFKYIDRLIKGQFELISAGDFRPIPLNCSDYKICQVCEFRGFCGFEDSDATAERKAVSDEDFWGELEGL